MKLISKYSGLLLLLYLLNDVESNNLVVRPGITTRKSSEGLGRTFDKGVKDTNSLLEKFYDGDDDWRRYRVVTPDMESKRPSQLNSEEVPELQYGDENKIVEATERSAAAQTPADYKFPDVVLPQIKGRIPSAYKKDIDMKDEVKGEDSQMEGGFSDVTSGEETEVLRSYEESEGGTEYDYRGQSEGFGPSDMGFEALEVSENAPTENYSYEEVMREGSEGIGDYGFQYLSESGDVDKGMSYILRDEKSKLGSDDYDTKYIYKSESGEGYSDEVESDFTSRNIKETRYLDESEDSPSERSIAHQYERGSESEYSEKHVDEYGKPKSEGEYSEEYVNEGSEGGTEYDYYSEVNKKKGSKKRNRVGTKPRTNKKDLNDWEDLTDDEREVWNARNARKRGRKDEEYDVEDGFINKPGRRKRSSGGEVPEDELAFRRRRKRDRRGATGGRPFDERYDIVGSRTRRSKKRPSARGGFDDINYRNINERRGRRGYDNIREIDGDPYMVTVRDRILSKYPNKKRDDILELRDSFLRSINSGKIQNYDYDDLIDPVDLMILYRDRNKMPVLSVKRKGNIPLEFLLKLPKGTYRWEELDPKERNKLKQKWKEEIASGTFWDDDKIHGDWGEEMRLLGEWGEEETLRGVLGRETRGIGDPGMMNSYYIFEPKFTDLKGKGVFSGEYPEDLEHSILVGDLYPEKKLVGDFRFPQRQILKYHPEFIYQDDDLVNDFNMENLQTSRNGYPYHWKDSPIKGRFGMAYPEDKYSWIESLDMDDAINLIRDAQYNDPEFVERLLYTYPWLKEKLGDSLIYDDDIILPVQVLNEFVPRSINSQIRDDLNHPAGKWYFSEVPDDGNLDRYFSDISKYLEPPTRRLTRGREARGLDLGDNVLDLNELINDEYVNSGWDRETINYLRELFKDAENRILDMNEDRRYPPGKRRRHILNSNPDIPIWYFGTDEQMDREKQLEFAIESDSLGGIIESRPLGKQIFVDPRGVGAGGVIGLNIQELGSNDENDLGSLYLNSDYIDNDDLEELDLETMANYITSRAPISSKKWRGEKSINTPGHHYPFEYRNDVILDKFKPRRRIIYGDDDIDEVCPLSISQSEFLQSNSGFNPGNQPIINIMGLRTQMRPNKANKKKKGRSKMRTYRVNEFGHEDPMDILMSYYDSNENSILDVFDDKGIYMPTDKRVGYGVNDVDYIRRSNDDDWSYLKLLRDSLRKERSSKKRDNRPLWYYYDSIGKRWDDTLEKDDDAADSSIDLILKEIETERRGKRGHRKNSRSESNKRRGNLKNKKRGKKQKRVHFKIDLNSGESLNNDWISDITHQTSDSSSQEVGETEDEMESNESSDSEEEDVEELSPLGKRLLMAAGYEDDLDPSKPLSIDSEMINVIDTGKRRRTNTNKGGKKRKGLDDMLDSNMKILLDNHDLSEIRRIRRDMDDESGDLEALKNLIRKLHLNDYINLDDDSKEVSERSEMTSMAEMEQSSSFVGEKDSSEDVSSAVIAPENEHLSELKTESSEAVEDIENSDGKPMKLIKFKKGKMTKRGGLSDKTGNSESSYQDGTNSSDSQFDEELSLSEWDSLIDDTIREIQLKNNAKKRKNSRNNRNRSRKNIRKSKDEKKALNSLGVTPNVVRRVNLLLKDRDGGVKAALDFLLNELEDKIETKANRNGRKARGKGKRADESKENDKYHYYDRRPYDLEPVTPSFSRYIIKLNDVLGPKEALEELVGNLGVDLSSARPVRKGLRRYITPSVINEVNRLRRKKNGDELALNKLMQVLRIPRRGANMNKNLTKKGIKLPALLNEDDIKTVNRLLKRNKAPQALEFFIKNTGMERDLEDLKNGFYKMGDSYSGLNLPAKSLVNVVKLKEMGPHGCREALSTIYDDLGIPKQKRLFDGSLEGRYDNSLDLPGRDYQRRMVMPRSILKNGGKYDYLYDDLSEDYGDSEEMGGYSQYDDFSTIIPKREMFRLVGSDTKGADDNLFSALDFPLGMGKRSVGKGTGLNYKDNYGLYGNEGRRPRTNQYPPRLSFPPLMTKYDDEIRNYVNNRRNRYGMPDVPSYHYWNYYPEITGRSKYSDLENNANKRRKAILDRKRKLRDYLDMEHSVPVPVEVNDKSSKMMILKSYVDDDLPVNKEEMMLMQKPDSYSEEELYEIGQKLNDIRNNAESGKLRIAPGDTKSSVLHEYRDEVDRIGSGFETRGSKEEIISSLVSDPSKNIAAERSLTMKEVADGEDSVIRKLNNLIIDRPMMNMDDIPDPVETLTMLKELKDENPSDKGLTSYVYLDTSLNEYDKQILSDKYVSYLEKTVKDVNPDRSQNLMEKDCIEMRGHIKLKELNCDGLSREDVVTRTKPLDARKFSRMVSKVKNIYAKAFLKQISLACDIARLFFRSFSDFKAWNKAMDKHRWVALPLVSPQSYVPNMGGLNIFQRIMYNQVTKKHPRHSPRRVIILAISSKTFSDRRLPHSLSNIEYSSKNHPVEYVMNVKYNKDGMMVIPLVDLALCVRGGLQMHNLSLKQINKSSKPRIGTCLIGGVKTHSATQKVYRTALRYLEMSSDLTLAKFMIIPIRVGKEVLSEQLKLTENNNVEKNFDLQIPEDTIAPMISDMEFSRMQFDMTHENTKQVRERYIKKLINLNESIFKIYLMSSRELDIRSLKANGPRTIVIPMSFPQLYIKGYNNAQKFVDKIQRRYKPTKLSNRAYRNKLKPGFILLINDKTVQNNNLFLKQQVRRIQSFFTNPYSFKNFKSKKYEGPVFEIRGVNDLLTRKYLLDAIARASRQPSVVPMIILPIFVDNNQRSQKSDRKSMNKSLKKAIKHSANI